MNKVLKSSFLAIILILILIGCNSATDNDTTSNEDAEEENNASPDEQGLRQDLHIAYSAQPPTLDPYLTTAVITSDVMRGVYETLITVNEDYEFQPMLAESYDLSEDGTEITFTLRQGVLFHNGQEMTADDVVASMNRWKEFSNRAGAFQKATFEKIDDYTVLLTLEEPISTALSVLAGMLGSYAAIMPKDIIVGATELGVQEYIGTGPFQFDEWKQDSYIKVTKFDDYQPLEAEPSGSAGRKEALVEEVYFYFVTDPSTRVAGILSGEYDIIHPTPYNQAEILEDNPEIENYTIPGSTLVFIMNKNMEVFKDVRVREAVRLAFDEDSIMQSASADEQYYELNHNLVKPHLTNRFDTEIGKAEMEAYDPEAAKQQLEDLGVAGEELIIITTRDYEEQYNASLVAQQQLEAVGFKVSLEVYDWPTLIDKTYEETGYHINIMSWGAQPEPTAYGFLNRGQDSGWLDDQEFYDLIDDFRRQPSLDETDDAYDAIMQWMTDHVPLLKLGDTYRVFSASKKVNNLQFQDGINIWNLTVSE